MKVFITGISGMTGSYLAELYVAKGWEVHGIVRQRSDLRFLENVKAQVCLYIQDIRDPHGMMNVIRKVKPDIIHACAAMTYVPYSWENPLDTCETNLQGTINILEAAKALNPMPTVHYCSSSEVYGAVPKDKTPITEKTEIYSASPYGVSKYAGDLMCQVYHRSYGLKTIITRAFNHTSPRRGEQFLTQQVVSQAIDIKNGKRTHFTLGNMDAIRDYSDARDIAEAYYLAVTHPEVEYGTPYNLCSGVGYSVREVVNMVSDLAGISDKVIQDLTRIRPSDCPILLGSAARFKFVTKWEPKHVLKDTLQWMLDTKAGEE